MDEPAKPEYVGGRPDEPASSAIVGWVWKGIAAIAILAVLAGADIWGMPLARSLAHSAPSATPTQVTTYNGQPEPGATARFMAALRAHDPVAMRAEITPACVADTASSLCFDSSSDTTFQAGLKDKVITYTFVASWSGDGPFKVAVYRMNVVGGGEYTMNFVLSPEGKILRAALMGVKPV